MRPKSYLSCLCFQTRHLEIFVARYLPLRDRRASFCFIVCWASRFRAISNRVLTFDSASDAPRLLAFLEADIPSGGPDLTQDGEYNFFSVCREELPVHFPFFTVFCFVLHENRSRALQLFRPTKIRPRLSFPIPSQWQQ